MNPLEFILDWYSTARDSLRVTQRVLRSGDPHAITEKHVFYERTTVQNQKGLEIARRELDDLAVLALVAAFERLLRQHVVNVIANHFPLGNAVEKTIEAQLKKDAEFWRFSEDLVAVFVTATANHRRQIKQLIDLRDWIAHGKAHSVPEVQRPHNADVSYTYQTLTDFLTIARVI